ncbi:MAG: GntR family transcriptional regulator [Rhizobiaceae bacterium]|nr:GntR family transcriptional regulator [Rhizobiaceae bacterium]MCV0407502.1 GntR family transcriptional regulator [Rhizobiaceae bacterium]
MEGSPTVAQGRLTPIRRETFSNQIATNLRHAIISGEIEAGSQITEMELAARFGVSRGPLREAMGLLVSEGLLVTAPYRGTRVLKLSAKDVREIYALRTALETLAFREVWDRRDETFRAELKSRHRILISTLGLNDRVKSSEAEIRFHSLVYEASGHDLLLETWQRISSRMQLYLAVHQQAHGRTAPIHDAHQRYLELALDDRLDLMVEEVEAHMRRGLHQMMVYLA